MKKVIMALDQGTTSTRVLVLEDGMRRIARGVAASFGLEAEVEFRPGVPVKASDSTSDCDWSTRLIQKVSLRLSGVITST